jgi:hypothetical protein
MALARGRLIAIVVIRERMHDSADGADPRFNYLLNIICVLVLENDELQILMAAIMAPEMCFYIWRRTTQDQKLHLGCRTFRSNEAKLREDSYSLFLYGICIL